MSPLLTLTVAALVSGCFGAKLTPYNLYRCQWRRRGVFDNVNAPPFSRLLSATHLSLSASSAQTQTANQCPLQDVTGRCFPSQQGAQRTKNNFIKRQLSSRNSKVGDLKFDLHDEKNITH